MSIQSFSNRSVAAAGVRLETTVWLNGRLLPARDAGVSPFDQGLLTGDGVFETLVAWGGEAFALHRHWLRLGRSAERFGIPVPGEELLRHAIGGVLHTNQLQRARVRVTVTMGDAPMGGAGAGAEVEPMVLVAAVPLNNWPATERVALVPFTRNPGCALSGCKSVSYGDNMIALRWAQARGAGEAIFGNVRGELCEGTGSNVFVVREGRLLTPPLESGCLAGVTRGLVLELATAEGMSVGEETLPVAALAGADEAFLTSTTREIQPISHVDDQPLPVAPGPVTLRLQQLWAGLIERGMEP
jgi:branched-chain amino acid aminotransferase